MKKVFMIMVLLIVAVVGYKFLKPKPTDTNYISSVDSTQMPVSFTDFEGIPPSYVDEEASSPPTIVAPVAVSAPKPVASSFSCDGRQHCSQMTSCAEATYFIQHCPNTKMDGNNDGIPCEQQWCK